MSGRWFHVLCGGLAALLVAELFLPGCAMSTSASRPADFPFHMPVPPVDIHWRLNVDSNVVQADGLIERRQHYVRSAWLQLLGFDATGGIVSFTAPIWVSWRSESDLESFTIALRPRGQEQPFEVRLHSFEYPEEAPP